jgi:hypothetical protein
MPNDSESTIGLTYAGRPRTWGFRFSVVDGIVLVISVVLSIGGYQATAGFSLLILFVVLHFFLFCNVFRIRRKPELIWAGAFLLNCGLWLLLGRFNLATVTIGQSLLTIILLSLELRLPCYHGIFARRINPRLDDYLFEK